MSASGGQPLSSTASDNNAKSLEHIQRPFTKSRRQISHGNSELVRQPDGVFSVDGGEKECVFAELEKMRIKEGVCHGHAAPAAQIERGFAS